ncbi:hypothetical protein CONCODRAFT_80187 [Conidiobolus coronatus NRRL 28638]|uniref:Uncharacterized protein n=1 Tax=Conidiobolus coronatus (strain ATCC 28846 / CBS 209.66 / NRRL 28638) TaxID=796925 RepID=A0A137NXD4_CONC2|nr:hypothetical protein CONCODRAFT_80187 [Conidiobolus coronatus NRRL 28638]|eukprot:KXN67372.1 hypothetical protein CONCODRAFT_80187 [Conidiobolus coronatus NRRL 28638]
MPSALPIQTLVETIQQTLSRDHQVSSTDGPAIANSHQLLVLTTHAILSSSNDPNFSFPTSEPYRLIYGHSDTENKYELKFITVGKKMTIYAIVIDEDQSYSLELDPSSILNENLSFPLPLNQLDNAELFSNQSKLEKLIDQIHNSIIFSLIPQLEDVSNRGPNVLLDASYPATPNSRNSESRDDPLNDPLRDERFIPASLGRYRGHPDLEVPSVGASDLDPLGGAFSGPRFGGIGGNMDPFGGGLGNDGMYVGPNHPIFNQQRPRHDPIHGGDGILPPGAVPPGARFDPIGPFGGPNRGGQRGPGSGGRFSGNPDNDELPPPGGYNDMFM